MPSSYVIDPKDRKILEQIDNALQRLRTNVRVDMPYFLTSASRDTDNLPSPLNWHRDSFFEQDEQHLQYQTWYYREDAEDLCCIELHGGVEEERRRTEKAKRVGVKGQRSASVSSASSHGDSYQSTPKKKISFQEYRKRKLGGAEASMSPDIRTATTTARTASNGDSRRTNASRHTQEVDAKRRRDGGREGGRVHSDVSRQDPKTDRMTGRKSAPAVRPSSYSSSSMLADLDPFDLPELLSPTFDDPKQNPPFGFPALLSPLSSLPAMFRKDLAAHKSQLGRGDDSGDAASQRLEPSDKSLARSRANTYQSKTSISSRNFGDAEPSSHMSNAVRNHDHQRNHSYDHESLSKAPSLRVKLKYGVKRRREVQRILSSRSRPDSDDEEPLMKQRDIKSRDDWDGGAKAGNTGKDMHSKTNGVVRPEGATGAKGSDERSSHQSHLRTPETGNKRPPVDDLLDTTPRKRAHTLSSSTFDRKVMQTPTKADRPSQSVSHKRSESLRSQPSLAPTPMKDLKATSMSRTHSAESMTTPRFTESTPGPAGKAPTSEPSTNGIGSKANHPLKKLEAEASATGKKLKMYFQSVLDKVRARDKVSEAERKKGAMAGLESVLHYILLFASQEAYLTTNATSQGKKPPPPTGPTYGHWYTLLPLFNLVPNLTREFPHLHGLHAHIGVAIANAFIVRWNQLGSAVRRSEEPCTKSGGHSLSALEVFERVMRELPGWAADADASLDIQTIIDDFPTTWAQRGHPAKGAAGAARSNPPNWENDLLAHATALKDGRPKPLGRIGIPATVDAGPVQVVRFACAILREFAEREKLDYALSLKF